MTPDDLNAPLGLGKGKRLSKLPASPQQILASALGVSGLVVVGWATFVHDPLGGQPVAVVGAMPGDAVAIRIKDIEVTSLATASGNDQAMEGRFNGDPYIAAVCAGCGTEWPETRVEGIGPESVRCVNCGADCTPFTFTNGYTIAFDELRSVGVTVPREAACIRHPNKACASSAAPSCRRSDAGIGACRPISPSRARSACKAVMSL